MLKQYEKACQQLAEEFIRKVFNELYDEEDSHWIGNIIGEVLYINDHFIGMDNIANYFRYQFTPEEFFEWYDLNMETGISMNYFKKR